MKKRKIGNDLSMLTHEEDYECDIQPISIFFLKIYVFTLRLKPKTIEIRLAHAKITNRTQRFELRNNPSQLTNLRRTRKNKKTF